MIVVTGMHRSGTSFVCRLLTSLGLDFGDPSGFLAADDWNAAGYFEARDVLDANSRLITGFPRTAGKLRAGLSQMAYLRMPSLAAIRKRAGPMQSELQTLAGRYADLAVKDPRFCVTLPVWREVSEVTHVVVGVRHPESVARSLQRRQRIPIRVGLRFWAYHVDALLSAVPADTGFFAQFELLRGDAALSVTARLAEHVGLAADENLVAGALERSMRRDLVHHDRAGSEALPPPVQALWNRLCDRVSASCGTALA
jgi:hypothetical protein